jgi:hypothetical protein
MDKVKEAFEGSLKRRLLKVRQILCPPTVKTPALTSPGTSSRAEYKC